MTDHGKTTRGGPNMSVSLKSVRLANPVLTASGTCGYANELSYYADLGQLGGFITKSITREPRCGNPPRRTAETVAGMLNAIGLANVGLEAFIRDKAPLLERFSVPVFVNVAGKTVDEYVEVAARLSELEMVRGLELNISCPNVREGGLTFGTDAGQVSRLVGAVRRACGQTVLIVKLSPNVTDITVTARAAVEAGADVLSLVNTFLGMAIDVETRRPLLGNRTGGLSGPAIKPMAVYLVHRVYQEVAGPAGIPIIGLGGICRWQDAIEFMIAGATAVAVGTQMLVDPGSLGGILDGMREYLVRHDIESISELVGTTG